MSTQKPSLFARFIKKRENTMLFVLAGMIVISFIVSPTFRSISNIMNILNQNAIYGVMALGMAFCILSGAIDLSAGSVAALTAVVVAVLFGKFGFVIGLLGGLLVGALIGAINGLLITKAKINYFVTTLGMMSFVRGVIYIVTNGYSVRGTPAEYGVIGLGKIGPIPIAASIWLVLAVILYFILKYTRLGQYIYSIGGNENAAWLSGVNVDKIKIIAFMICGIFSALGGILLNLRVLVATADACNGYEMTAIASCIVGGISLSGGRGNIFGSVIGALILGLISNMIQLLGINSYWQSAITGLIIILAVGVDSMANRAKD